MACECNSENYLCPGTSLSSNCVIWQGEPIPLFGICRGDAITFTILAIIEKINKLIADSEATLADFNIATCPALRDLLAGKDPSLSNLIQILWTNGCTLRDLIRQVENKIDNEISKPAYPFSSKCITAVPLTGKVDTDAYVQGIINKVCELEGRIASIVPSVETIIRDVLGDLLSQMITSPGGWGIKKSGSGQTVKYSLEAFVPPLGAIPYLGPVTNFDTAGKGLVGTPYEGWFLVTGLNGLPDARGRTLVGAINNVPGAPLDVGIDPSKPGNAGTNYNPGDKFGESFHQLTISEMPSHSHPLNDPGHSHGYRGYNEERRPCGSKCDRETSATEKQTSRSYTDITIAEAGGNGVHENRQPSLAITGWIVRLP